MNLTVNHLSSYKNFNNIKIKNKNNPNISFTGSINRKVAHYTGYTLAAALMAMTLSCSSQKSKNVSDKTDTINIISKSNDTSDKITNYEENNNSVVLYHYDPSDNEINGDNYAWKETIYPNGSIEKDSSEYKIHISPNGERTETKTETKDNGEKIITTTFPNGEIEIRTEDATNYTDTLFYANGNIKQIHNKKVEIQKGETPSDNKVLIKEQVLKGYDKNGILLYWESFNDSINMDDYKENFKYDAQNRLIDDSFAKYEYKGNSQIPFRITEELEGCKFITEFDDDGQDTNKYFKASNGVITPFAQIYSENW